MLFSPSCQCYKLNYVLLRTKTGWQTISQNYNLGQRTERPGPSLPLRVNQDGLFNIVDKVQVDINVRFKLVLVW